MFQLQQKCVRSKYVTTNCGVCHHDNDKRLIVLTKHNLNNSQTGSEYLPEWNGTSETEHPERTKQ